jgi:hypothetical protein
MLSYLAHYTHHVAIASSRLIAFDGERVAFTWKDYRREGRDCHRLMTLDARELICRFLLDVQPDGFHRIRHYGPLTNAARKANLAWAPS